MQQTKNHQKKKPRRWAFLDKQLWFNEEETDGTTNPWEDEEEKEKRHSRRSWRLNDDEVLTATTNGRATGSLEDENEEAATKRAVDFDSEHAVTAAMAKSEHHLGWRKGGSRSSSSSSAQWSFGSSSCSSNNNNKGEKAKAFPNVRRWWWLLLGWSGDRFPFVDRKWVELSTEPT